MDNKSNAPMTTYSGYSLDSVLRLLLVMMPLSFKFLFLCCSKQITPLLLDGWRGRVWMCCLTLDLWLFLERVLRPAKGKGRVGGLFL